MFARWGLTAAVQGLNSAVDQAFVAARRSPCRAASACVGLAGVDRDADRQAIQQWAQQRALAETTTIVHDAMTVLLAGVPSGVGIALVAGTGSLAFGRNPAGETTRSGGWGHVFGDEGSGYTIAVAGLRAASQMADGRGPRTTLLQAFLKELAVSEPADLISAIYDARVDKSKIAACGKLVFEAADQEDEVAREIISQATGSLSEMAAAVARRLCLDHTSLSLALAGGVLVNRADVCSHIEARLVQAGFNLHSTATVTDPVAGAIRIARNPAAVG